MNPAKINALLDTLKAACSRQFGFNPQRVAAGMGYFTPDIPYSWRAGDDGAEWIEIHSGVGGIFTDRPGS